jgi:CRISPR-associated endonuclease/helicase Cas3
MHEEVPILRYWGKAKPEPGSGSQWHPLIYHSLDVAACGRKLLEVDTERRRSLARLSGLAEEALLAWLSFLLAIHDLGKFSDGFQNLRPDLFQSLQEGRSTRASYDERHDTLGWLFAQDYLPSAFATDDTEALWDLLTPWVSAVTGHHGRPPNNLTPNRVALLLKRQFPAPVRQDANRFIQEVTRILLPEGLPFSTRDYDNLRPLFIRASWLVAGLAVAADWLGSNQPWFPYWDGSLLSCESYWHDFALDRANTALRESGLAPAAPTPFHRMTELFESILEPTPLQQLAESMGLEQGPQLIVIEEVTGGGKTEAALTLAARLLAADAADGIYLALPTMATADAMHSRVERVYQRFFADDANPSLVLAHSTAAFSLDLERANKADTGYGSKEHDSASDHCTAWLADSRKKALLAHVGVGTIDQALLGILAAKHQSLRLWGLLGKVFIADEVHACDAYVTGLLKTLLKFHAAFGGSAILLSATLPQSQRTGLIAAFMEGAGYAAPEVTEMAYPLVTYISTQEVSETPVAARLASRRVVRGESLPDLHTTIERLRTTLQEGHCACWVRNTVADALAAYALWVKEIGTENVLLDHARFALTDRLRIGAEVLKRFSKEGTAEDRRGRLVIATQVVEQSLDVDFDYMVTDLAPIDLIIQRAGRLKRHVRDAYGNPIQGEDMRGEAVLGVLMPVADAQASAGWYRAFFSRAAYVYTHHGQLWLTARWLQAHGAFTMPDNAREMIEFVYADGAGERIPEGLQHSAATAEGDAMADRSMAAFNSLYLDSGYEVTSTHWREDDNTPTRLGEPTTTVRLARVVNGQLVPWAQDAATHLWELSQVTVRAARINGESDRYGPMIAAAKERMRDSGKYCVVVPLEERDGVWRGSALGPRGEIAVTYSPTTGLSTGEGEVDESDL